MAPTTVRATIEPMTTVDERAERRDVRHHAFELHARLEIRGTRSLATAAGPQKLPSYTVARRRQGATIVEVASEVGISFRTLGRWLGDHLHASGRFDEDSVCPRGQAVRGKHRF
jgi:hypothetical protein